MTAIYSHRPFYCPYCATLDSQRDPDTIINQEELPVQFANKRQNDVTGITLTIRCPFCKQTYMANDEQIAGHARAGYRPEERIEALKEKIEDMEAEVSDLKMEISEHEEELEKTIQRCWWIK